MANCAAKDEGPPTAHRMRFAAALLVAFVFSACAQPQDESPGYRLTGEAMQAHVADWRFTNGIPEIFVQTTPWYLIPHSTTIWCAELDGNLYIGSYGPGGKKRWEHNVLRNPKAKVRLAGKLYNVSITPIADDTTRSALDAAYAKKYDMAEVFGDDLPS